MKAITHPTFLSIEKVEYFFVFCLVEEFYILLRSEIGFFYNMLEVNLNVIKWVGFFVVKFCYIYCFTVDNSDYLPKKI